MRPTRSAKSKAIAAIKKMYKKRRYVRRQKTSNVNRGLKPFASRYITKLKYSDTVSLTSANNWLYYFNLNSLWDPNRTGIGHQPYGFDQAALIYNRYRVISCSYVINCISQTGDTIRVAAIPGNEGVTTPFTLSALCEMPRCKWVIQSSGGNTQYLKGKSYIPALMGRTKQQYLADDRFQSEVTGSPAELAVLSIASSNLLDIGVNTSITITMEYLVEFFDPKILPQS